MGDDILSDFGIHLLEEEIDDVIFQTNEFLTDATFTGAHGPFWWILQMCMALAALFAIIMAAGMAYKMMVKKEPLDVMKLFKPLAVAVIMSWWYPPADTGITNSGSSWCVLDFLSYIPNAIGSYTHDLYQAEAMQITDKFEEVQQLIYVRDTMYTSLQAQADIARSGTMDPSLVESTMEQTGVDEVTEMGKDASRLWFTSLVSGATVCLDKIVMVIALIVYRIGWWATIYCQQILLGMLTIFGPIQWAFSLLPKWEMGFQPPTQMGRSLGEMDDTLLDGTFLWCDVVLRGILCIAFVRHCAVHPSGEPDGDNGERDNDGGIPAKLVLFGGLSDGCQHRSVEVSEPCARLGGMDDTGG